MSKKYRLCAAAVVFNSNGKVFLGNRIDTPDEAWQFPQGGIEDGETPETAARRELFEEAGIVSIKTVFSADAFLRYEFPQAVKDNFKKKGIYSDGQDVFFSLFFFNGKDNEINLTATSPEFCEYRWSDFDFAVENIVSFKKEVYEAAAKQLKPLIKQYIDSIS